VGRRRRALRKRMLSTLQLPGRYIMARVSGTGVNFKTTRKEGEGKKRTTAPRIREPAGIGNVGEIDG